VTSATNRPFKHHLLAWVLISVGLVTIAAAGAWQLRATLWMSHYRTVGTSLVRQEEARIAMAKGQTTVAGSAGADDPSNNVTDAAAVGSTASQAAGSSCPGTTAVGPQGLLELPDLGIVAPVEQGSGDAVLAVAVGHDPSSVWPGADGTAVLLSHDVTYFVDIGQLKPNDLVRYVTPCSTDTYKVTGQRVVLAGTTIYNSPTSTIDLVTCYPSNALFYTNQRLVVSLSLVKSSSSKQARSQPLSNDNVPTLNARAPYVPAPRALAAQGLTLTTNYAPMGTLSIVGTPNSRYVQSPAALLAQDSALTAYFGGLKALAERHLDWWNDLAPHVAAPLALLGHAIDTYNSAVNVTIDASNFAIRGVTLRTSIEVGGSTYTMQIDLANSPKNVMTVTSWRL